MGNPYRFLPYRMVLWLRRSGSFLWLVIVAGYLVTMAGNAMYRNYQAGQEMTGMRTRLKQAEIEKRRLDALLVYYHTDAFKEKELRRTLLMKRPAEKVYALPESSGSLRVEEELAKADASRIQRQSTLPIWKQWYEYVWHGVREG